MEEPLIKIKRRFRPEIEGLRVVAALLVAIYHIWFNRVSGGVDVFFVISGFLITTSIISTINKTSQFRFIPFISKLLKRLLPNVLFILSFVLILSFFLLPKSILNKTIHEVIASMFYYQNWQLAMSSTDYLDSTQMKSPVEHFWALSIQGQFYIIWFLVFALVLFLVRKFALSNGKKLVNFILICLFFFSLTYSIYLTNVNQPVAYFITFTRVWEFALGGLICVNLTAVKIRQGFATIIGWIGLIGLILTGIVFNVSTMFPGYVALWPMLCASFIVLSGNVETKYGVKKFLGSKIMVKLGGISFGIYLWHWVLLQFYRYNIQEKPTFLIGVLIILTSILLAYISTELIEKPIRTAEKNNVAFRRIVYLVVINLAFISLIMYNTISEKNKLENLTINKDYPGALAAVEEVDLPDVEPIPSFSTAFDDLPQSHIDGSNQNLKDTDVKIGEYGESENYSATIALIGSSVSEHWLGGILEAIEGTDYRVLSITRSGTRFSTGYDSDSDKGIWVENVLDYLRTADVDLVVAHATASDAKNDRINEWLVNQLQYVYESYEMDILAIRDNPRYSFSVLESLETNGYEQTKKLMNKEENQLDTNFWESFSTQKEWMYKLDLTDYFMIENEYEPIIGNIVVYRDHKHMTNTYSKSFGPVFKSKFNEIFHDIK